MSRRARALAFAGAALLCALAAALVARGYRADLAAEYGPLRTVVATLEALPPKRPLRPGVIERALEVRRAPERFIPPDAVSDPLDALGRSPVVAVPAGSYLLASQLVDPERPGRERRGKSTQGRSPVEIAVSGAGAIARAAGRAPRLVDVVVTSETAPGSGPGRTYVAARRVRLLDIRSAEADGEMTPGPSPAGWIATLDLDRAQALRLIQAESFARQIRIIPR